MEVRALSAIDFFYNMTDTDLHDIIEVGEIDQFCQALTLDFHDLEAGKIKNKA